MSCFSNFRSLPKATTALALTTATLGFSSITQAYIPLFDNQPFATDLCPISTNTNHTVVNGEITARTYDCYVEGTNVVYSLAVPEGCELGGCGLIVDNHGATMNANTENNGTQLREYGNTAVSRGALTPYIVLQPSFTDGFDDAGLFLDIGSVVGGGYATELPNMINVIDQVINAFNVDEDRMHFYGFSRGASTMNLFYCNETLKNKFASYAGGGGGSSCAVQAGKPLMIVNGISDPGQEFIGSATGNVEDFMLQQPNMVHQVIQISDNWPNRNIGFSFWEGITWTGTHYHQRFESGDYILETVRHSAKGFPYIGHCHPRTGIDRWLVCRADFDLGQKLIDFFIANPK